MPPGGSYQPCPPTISSSNWIFQTRSNNLYRDYMLGRVSEVIPELYKFCHVANNEHSILQIGESCLTSQEGSQG